MLLNSTQFSFVIDLAALASRRKYLNLDKWLNDKYREHQVTATFILVVQKSTACCSMDF